MSKPFIIACWLKWKDHRNAVSKYVRAKNSDFESYFGNIYPLMPSECMPIIRKDFNADILTPGRIVELQPDLIKHFSQKDFNLGVYIVFENDDDLMMFLLKIPT